MGGEAKVDEGHLSGVSIDHDVVWLHIIVDYVGMVDDFQGVDNLGYFFDNLLIPLNTGVILEIGIQIDI